MSATLRLADFISNERLFKVPPRVINVESRQFPVIVHFNKRTPDNYLKEALNKTRKIHSKLPEGGILIFVTGQREVNWLVQKLRKVFPFNKKHAVKENGAKSTKSRENEGEETVDDEDDDEGVKKTHRKRRKVKIVPQIDLDDYSIPGDLEFDSEEDGESDQLSSDDEQDAAESEDESRVTTPPLWTLPLYSMLSIHKQRRVFQPPPPGCRLCIVSTNVAETSLTIPDVKYVVDTGKCKVKLYDKVTGVTGHVVHWCSKAAANQRAGRAGRTQPGHCYRLYSSAVFNDTFAEHSPPEIQQKPVDDLYLQMKCMNIDKVVNFPFPTAPDLMQLKTAEQRLKVLGALDEKGNVTLLGRAISKFPVLPRYGKMLALSHQQDLLPYTVCLVAALSVQEVLLEVPIVSSGSIEDAKSARQRWTATRQRWAGQGQSLMLGDNMVLLKAVGAAEFAAARGKLERFCEENGLRHKAVVEIRKLRMQLTSCIKDNVPDVDDITVDPEMPPPTDLQAKLLRQILLAGMGDQVAKKIMPDELKEGEEKAKFKYAYRANNMEEPVFLHQGCVLRKTLPEYVVFQEIYETNKMYMRGVAAIEPEWLPIYVPQLCNLSDPLPSPEPSYRPDTGKIHCNVTGTFGPQAWPLPRIELAHPDGAAVYKWFARYLLEGTIFPKLAKFQPVLLSRPQVMVKSWSTLQPRTQELLKALQTRRCCTKTELMNIWSQDKRHLLTEYLKWLPESAHSEICLMWPPV
ncbi:unnamed protein product [Acanthoscelides obtectus]|nr:unnamed protein product [Acanthoscelides obtectus]CAK1677206.1 Probable ATP-dependent RNA helicase kurz [Acanthoscelides obtectus]